MTPPLPTLRFPYRSLAQLRADYTDGKDPADLVREIFARIQQRGADAVWIFLPPLEEILAALPSDRSLPLFGVPFGIKDNMDVAGWPTSAGCREYTYTAQRDSSVVKRLRAAGAIPIGKTNLDQFATGLVGTRSPYGVPSSVMDERYISGGSSSGSAVAVAAGLVAFALGTDTAGSGRVPAAFNGIVGLKPTKGLLSTSGLVPACRSLDCISVFAQSVHDAEMVLQVARGSDAEDPFSRCAPTPEEPLVPKSRLRIGVPTAGDLEFFGDVDAKALFHAAVDRLIRLGQTIHEIDYTPFRDVARLLYAGPWVAERLASIRPFLEHHSEAMHPVVREIISGGAQYTAVDAFEGVYELQRLATLADAQWNGMDALLLPTTGTTYTIAEVLADPVRLNSNLGRYTNFVNLLDLCAIAVPAGIRRSNGLPFGITFIARAFREQLACGIAKHYLDEATAASPAHCDAPPAGQVLLAVVGAHLEGQPLNHQLTSRGGRLVHSTRTAGDYRLYALPNTVPPKPGLMRDPGYSGSGIELEVWALDLAPFGDFVAAVPPPMVIGSITLASGESCKSFLCEPYALKGATEITHLGGWRAYLKTLASAGG